MGDVTISGARATTRAPEPPKAYPDNCILGAIAQDEPEEKSASGALLELWHTRRVDLVTSPVTLEEIDGVPDEHRRAHEVVYAMPAKVPTIDEEFLLLGVATPGPGVKGPIPASSRQSGASAGTSSRRTRGSSREPKRSRAGCRSSCGSLRRLRQRRRRHPREPRRRPPSRSLRPAASASSRSRAVGTCWQECSPNGQHYFVAR
jgi:hypothetical protein